MKRKPEPEYYDECQEKVVRGKDRPCYAKKGALCRTTDEYCCMDCRYWPKAKKKSPG